MSSMASTLPSQYINRFKAKLHQVKRGSCAPKLVVLAATAFVAPQKSRAEEKNEARRKSVSTTAYTEDSTGNSNK